MPLSERLRYHLGAGRVDKEIGEVRTLESRCEAMEAALRLAQPLIESMPGSGRADSDEGKCGDAIDRALSAAPSPGEGGKPKCDDRPDKNNCRGEPLWHFCETCRDEMSVAWFERDALAARVKELEGEIAVSPVSKRDLLKVVGDDLQVFIRMGKLLGCGDGEGAWKVGVAKLEALIAERDSLRAEVAEAMALLEPGRLFRADDSEKPTGLVERARVVIMALGAEADGNTEARAELKNLRAERERLKGERAAQSMSTAEFTDRVHAIAKKHGAAQPSAGAALDWLDAEIERLKSTRFYLNSAQREEWQRSYDALAAAAAARGLGRDARPPAQGAADVWPRDRAPREPAGREASPLRGLHQDHRPEGQGVGPMAKRGRPAKWPEDRRSVVFTMKVTALEKHAIERASGQEGKTASGWAAEKVLDAAFAILGVSPQVARKVRT